jgi:PST family polysaccharide transporter
MFREDMFIQIGMLVVRIGVSIGLARLGWGVWSLVVGALAGRAIATLLAWYIVPFVPKLRFDRRFFAQHWRSGGSILGSGILNYLMSNLDYWVIGRRFGATELGYYQVAFSLPEELRNRLSGPLQRILFPAYSRLQNNDEAFRKGVFKSVRVLSTVVVPMGIGMAAVAPDLVRVLYGEQWIAAIPLLQILAVGGVMRALFSLVASIYYAKGRPDLAFKISLYSLPYVALVIVIGSEWGVIGVAWAMVVVQIPSFFAINIAMRLIHASSMSFYRQIIPPVLAGLTMVWLINIVGFNPYIQQLLPIYKLGCLVVSGAVGYGLCIIAISKIHTKDLLELARVVP